MRFPLAKLWPTVVTALVFVSMPLAAQPHFTLGPSAGSTTINFNGFADETVISNQIPGVTVSGGLCATNAYTSLFGGDPMQATNFDVHNLGVPRYACDGNFAQPITFVFSQAISSFGFNLLTQGGDVTLTTSNGAVSTGTPNFNMQYFGIADDAPFTSVQLSVAGNGLFAIDDVAIAPTAVPEPASIALVATGLIGAFGVTRRRRR